MILEEKRAGLIARARYLKANDHQTIKSIETGVAIDPAIIAKKQQARDEYNLIESATSSAEIEHLTVEFE